MLNDSHTIRPYTHAALQHIRVSAEVNRATRAQHFLPFKQISGCAAFHDDRSKCTYMYGGVVVDGDDRTYFNTTVFCIRTSTRSNGTAATEDATQSVSAEVDEVIAETATPRDKSQCAFTTEATSDQSGTTNEPIAEVMPSSENGAVLLPFAPSLLPRLLLLPFPPEIQQHALFPYYYHGSGSSSGSNEPSGLSLAPDFLVAYGGFTDVDGVARVNTRLLFFSLRTERWYSLTPVGGAPPPMLRRVTVAPYHAPDRSEHPDAPWSLGEQNQYVVAGHWEQPRVAKLRHVETAVTDRSAVGLSAYPQGYLCVYTLNLEDPRHGWRPVLPKVLNDERGVRRAPRALINDFYRADVYALYRPPVKWCYTNGPPPSPEGVGNEEDRGTEKESDDQLLAAGGAEPVEVNCLFFFTARGSIRNDLRLLVLDLVTGDWLSKGIAVGLGTGVWGASDRVLSPSTTFQRLLAVEGVVPAAETEESTAVKKESPATGTGDENPSVSCYSVPLLAEIYDSQKQKRHFLRVTVDVPMFDILSRSLQRSERGENLRSAAGSAADGTNEDTPPIEAVTRGLKTRAPRNVVYHCVHLSEERLLFLVADGRYLSGR